MKKFLVIVGTSVFFTVGFMFLFSANVMAYIDPSVMTYTIQAVAGIVIVIGAGIGIYFRKAKKKINDKLGVDEKKEVEDDNIMIVEKKEK